MAGKEELESKIKDCFTSDPEKALGLIDELIRLDSSGHGVFINKGILLYKLKRYDDAVATFKKSMQIKQTDVACYYIALSESFLKNADEAIAYFDRAERLYNPQGRLNIYEDIYMEKGMFLCEIGRYDEAEELLQRCYDVYVREGAPQEMLRTCKPKYWLDKCREGRLKPPVERPAEAPPQKPETRPASKAFGQPGGGAARPAAARSAFTTVGASAADESDQEAGSGNKIIIIAIVLIIAAAVGGIIFHKIGSRKKAPENAAQAQPEVSNRGTGEAALNKKNAAGEKAAAKKDAPDNKTAEDGTGEAFLKKTFDKYLQDYREAMKILKEAEKVDQMRSKFEEEARAYPDMTSSEAQAKMAQAKMFGDEYNDVMANWKTASGAVLEKIRKDLESAGIKDKKTFEDYFRKWKRENRLE